MVMHLRMSLYDHVTLDITKLNSDSMSKVSSVQNAIELLFCQEYHIGIPCACPGYVLLSVLLVYIQNGYLLTSQEPLKVGTVTS